MAGAHPSTVVDYIVSGRLYPVRLSERTVRIPVRAVVDLREPELLAPPVVIDDPNAANVTALLDAVPGVFGRAQEGLLDVQAGRVVRLEDL